MPAVQQLSSHPVTSRSFFSALAYADLRVRWGVARARAHGLDPDDEFRGLYLSDGHVDDLLATGLGQNLWTRGNGQALSGDEWEDALEEARERWLGAAEPDRLLSLREKFDLAVVEVELLLLALLPEVDARYESLFAYLQDDVTRKRPGVDLLLNLLAGSFGEKVRLRRHLQHDAPLFRQRLLEWADGGRQEELSLLSRPLRPAPRVVEHILGHDGLSAELAEAATLYRPETMAPGQALPPAFRRRLARVATEDPAPILALVGGYGSGKRAAAQEVAREAGAPLLELALPLLARPWTDGLRVALRDARLLGAVLYVSGWDALLDTEEHLEPLLAVVGAYPGCVLLGSERVWQPPHRRFTRPFHLLPLPEADYQRRLSLWEDAVAPAEPASVEPAGLQALANQFAFTPGEIRDAVRAARDLARWEEVPLAGQHLFAASRALSNQNLSALATKIEPRYGWEEIVLPDDTRRQLGEMVETVRHRPRVYHEWGFGEKMALGKGLNALFAGESGTGKTMAADIIAGALGLDLYKIDLSGVVSKYIGETEKNLNRIFQEAETSNAILFFDEADALFGKRSEVKDSHDRYANVEISYLLQRMEAFGGIVILATNLRGNLDEAFTRRLHFVVEFPFPGVDDRERIWEVTVPAGVPLAGDVDWRVLAERFRLAGGNIRNIVLAAAFLAAEADTPLGMAQLLHAARREYQKLGRLMNEDLFGGY